MTTPPLPPAPATTPDPPTGPSRDVLERLRALHVKVATAMAAANPDAVAYATSVLAERLKVRATILPWTELDGTITHDVEIMHVDEYGLAEYRVGVTTVSNVDNLDDVRDDVIDYVLLLADVELKREDVTVFALANEAGDDRGV